MMNCETLWNAAGACPKRVWVLQALSDDEARQEQGELPHGLRAHLSHCPSCRELADRLVCVTGGLTALGAVEPDNGLSARAEARLRAALDQGAPLTGRVRIPDDLMLAAATRTARPWRIYVPLAEAAALALAATLVGLHSMRENEGQHPVAPTYVQGDDGGRATDPRATDAAPGGSVIRAPSVALAASVPPRVRLYNNPVDAAEANDDGSVQAAFTLPDPSRRGLSILIDRRVLPGSTPPNPSSQQP